MSLPGPNLPPPKFVAHARLDIVIVRETSAPQAANITAATVSFGVVVNTGPGSVDFFGASTSPGGANLGTSDLSPGNKVMYPTGSGEAYDLNGVHHRLIRNDQILATWTFQ